MWRGSKNSCHHKTKALQHSDYKANTNKQKILATKPPSSNYIANKIPQGPKVAKLKMCLQKQILESMHKWKSLLTWLLPFWRRQQFWGIRITWHSLPCLKTNCNLMKHISNFTNSTPFYNNTNPNNLSIT